LHILQFCYPTPKHLLIGKRPKVKGKRLKIVVSCQFAERESFLSPFHAAEQQSKEWNNGSAERERLSEPTALCEQRRAAEGQVNGCHFWFVLGQAKMNV
jgi:hypothetical protein